MAPDTAALCGPCSVGDHMACLGCRCAYCADLRGTATAAPSDFYVVQWRDDATLRDRIEARNVEPHAAFSRELLAQADGERLIYDGQTITLDVDNGRWVWQVTGQSADGSVIYGRWPD